MQTITRGAMYKFVFYVPAEHLEAVKTAAFEAGAGSIGNYDRCCWQVLGQGQFRPLPGSNPHIGQQDLLEIVKEYRVEMVCEESKIREVLKAFKLAHPYEEPAYDVCLLAEF